jgi:zinc transport system substrate-binding protein
MKPGTSSPLPGSVPAAGLAILALCLFSCNGQGPTEGTTDREGPLTVYTAFYPAWFFTSTIGGESVRAVNPIPADEDPIFYQPPTEMILRYQNEADLIVLNGAGFARWAAKAMLPEGKIVNTGKSFEDDLIVIKGSVTHTHGEGEKHTHAGIDGHTWIDPQLAMEQCRAIAAALSEHDPDHAPDFAAGLERVLAGLAELDTAFSALAKKGLTRPIVASHPAYNYLCRRYGWEVESFDFNPAENPVFSDLKRLKSYLTAHPGITHMVWEEAPEQKVAELFRSRFGLEPLVFSPVETPPDEGADYFAVMKENAKNIEPLFGPK